MLTIRLVSQRDRMLHLVSLYIYCLNLTVIDYKVNYINRYFCPVWDFLEVYGIFIFSLFVWNDRKIHFLCTYMHDCSVTWPCSDNMKQLVLITYMTNDKQILKCMMKCATPFSCACKWVLFPVFSVYVKVIVYSNVWLSGVWNHGNHFKDHSSVFVCCSFWACHRYFICSTNIHIFYVFEMCITVNMCRLVF